MGQSVPKKTGRIEEFNFVLDKPSFPTILPYRTSFAIDLSVLQVKRREPTKDVVMGSTNYKQPLS